MKNLLQMNRGSGEPRAETKTVDDHVAYILLL